MENEVERGVVDEVPGEKPDVVNGGLGVAAVEEKLVVASDSLSDEVKDAAEGKRELVESDESKEVVIEERVVVAMDDLSDAVKSSGVKDTVEGKSELVESDELKEVVIEERVVVDLDEPKEKEEVVETSGSKDANVAEESLLVESGESKESEVTESGESKNTIKEDNDEGKEENDEGEGVVAESGEPKELEEEIFEEAVDSPEKLPSQGTLSELVGGLDIVNDGNENPDAGNESETFVEAVGILAQDDVNLESPAVAAVDDKVASLLVDEISEQVTSSDDLALVVAEEKVEVLLGGESIDKIDEGGTSNESGNETTEETIVFHVNGGHEGSNGGALVTSSEDTKDSSEIHPTESEKSGSDSDLSTQSPSKVESEKVTILDVVSRDEECGELKHNIVTVDSTNGVSTTELPVSNLAVDGKPEDGGNEELKLAASIENHDESCEVKDIAVIQDSPALEKEPEPEVSAAPRSIAFNEPKPEPAAVPAPIVSEAPVLEEAVLSPSLPEKEVIQPSTVPPSASSSKSPLEEKSNGGDIKTVIAEGSGKKEVEAKTEDKREVETAHTNGVRGVHLAPRVAASNSQKSASPAGLGRAAPLLEPAQRPVQQQQQRVNGTMSNAQSQQIDESSNGEGEEFDETREKLQMIRVKFLRLAHRLGQTPHNVVVAQVLYRLGLAEQLRGRNGGRVGAFSFDRASAMAEQLEAVGQEPLDFTCTIMVIGKSGVGKSATINSIFDEVKFNTDAFQSGTKRVQDVVGTVQGIKVRVIDTPGLLPSWSEQRYNEKVLNSVKRFISKTPPDIVLYLDRLDMQTRDSGDMPLLRTITDIFGPSIWFNAIVVLTHAASAPPEGPNGTVSSYDMFVTQRSHIVQQAIRQAAGDMRLMNPVSLVENHSACRTNRAGQRVLPNGQVWKPHLLLLSFASKILAEANTLLKLQDSPPGKAQVTRSRAPPLPFLLSSLLQSRPQVKLPEEQFGDEDGADDDLDDDSDSEDEPDYDELPPFKSLTKAQIGKLTKDQKKAYFEELEYREKLYMKKQLKEERRRRKLMKKMAKEMPAAVYAAEEEESGGAASVPVPMPDLALPASFDSDNPTHRFRSLDNSNQWFVRPVLDSHGWDHDIGYDGINAETLFVVKEKIPVTFSGQVTKDKKDANIQMEVATSLKHGEGKKKATSLGFDMQTVGKDLAYTFRGETMLANFKKNKAAAGVSVTLLGDALSAGAKFEDKLVLNKRFRMVVSGGAMSGRGDVAYGGSLEAQLRDKDYPLGRSLSTLGLSVMDWHGDLAIGCNVQSQIPFGRSTNLIARANLNNRGAGQVSLRLNSSEQLQIALVGLLPLLQKVFWVPKQLQYGQ